MNDTIDLTAGQALPTKTAAHSQDLPVQAAGNNAFINRRSLRAVCVDVIDLGAVETAWGQRHQVKLVFETEERKPNDFPRNASRTYTRSFYEKANLRKDIESWQARPLTATQLQAGINLRSLIGKACTLDVCDAISKAGHPYLRIVGIGKATGHPLPPSGSYRRWDDTGASPQAGSPKPGDVSVGVEDQEAELNRQAEAMLTGCDQQEGGQRG